MADRQDSSEPDAAGGTSGGTGDDGVAGVAGRPPGFGRRVVRRLIIVVVVVGQLTMIVAAYDSDHKTFGFQMFPESSRWEADIVRVQGDGTRISVRDEWEYVWSDLVAGRGLTNPFVNHHADSGIRNQLGYLQGALDWVAEHTPDDVTTEYLEAVVTYTDNGRGPFTRTLRSVDRVATPGPGPGSGSG